MRPRPAGAKPVLITSIVRRNFDADGKIKRDSLVPYVEAVRELAAAKGVPLLDLYALTLKQAEDLGTGRCGESGGADQGRQAGHHAPRTSGTEGDRGHGGARVREGGTFTRSVSPRTGGLARCMRQKKDWYGGAESLRIADNLLLYQHDNGGWEKNIDMAMPLGSAIRAAVIAGKKEAHTTIDNDATYTQMNYLARVYTATRRPEYRDGFERGFEYLLKAQYPNGGWPQFYPSRNGYWDHITYDDDAMIGVMETLRAIVDKEPDYLFAGDDDRAKARAALTRAVDAF